MIFYFLSSLRRRAMKIRPIRSDPVNFMKKSNGSLTLVNGNIAERVMYDESRRHHTK